MLSCQPTWLFRRLLLLLLLSQLVVATEIAAERKRKVNIHEQRQDDSGGKAISCLSSSCSSKWTSWSVGQKSYGYDTPCSVASGNFPTSIRLPFYFPGNYQLCRTFEMAHYCRIDIENLVIPSVKNKGAFLLGGPFRLDQCISRKCKPDALLDHVKGQIAAMISEVSLLEVSNTTITRNVNKHADADKLIDEQIRNNLDGLLEHIKIFCYPTEISQPDSYGILMLTFWYASVAMTLISTILVTKLPGFRISQFKIFSFFNASANASRLMATTPGDFTVLNGFRFFSMVWVITGHAVLTSSNVMNPTAIARVLQGFGFVFIRGGFFAVDTFFFMSGFLAARGLIPLMSKQKLSWKLYSKAVVARYLRLTPAYFVVVVTAWKVLPHQTPFPVDAVSVPICEKYFWTNMLYINNIIPWANAGTQEECAGWTWYLANDFQFFLLAPFLVQFFLIGLKRNSPFLKYFPCILLILIQIIASSFVWADLTGASDPHYSDRFYVKPWIRITPYAVGVLAAFIHFQREQNSAGNLWKNLPFPDWQVITLYFGSILTMYLSVVVIYQQYKCKASKHECEVWYAQYKYGYYISGNWPKTVEILYNAFQYLWWSVPLAILSYILFCDEKYDFLNIRPFMGNDLFAPLARLTYNAYLVHIPLMIVKLSLDPYLPDWHVFRITLEVLGYIVCAYATSFILFILVEKPIMNIVAYFLAPKRNREQEAVLVRRASSFSDPDNENLLMMEVVTDNSADMGYMRMESRPSNY